MTGYRLAGIILAVITVVVIILTSILILTIIALNSAFGSNNSNRLTMFIVGVVIIWTILGYTSVRLIRHSSRT